MIQWLKKREIIARGRRHRRKPCHRHRRMTGRHLLRQKAPKRAPRNIRRHHPSFEQERCNCGPERYNYEQVRYSFERVRYSFERVRYNFERVRYNYERVRYNYERVRYNYERVRYNRESCSCGKIRCNPDYTLARNSPKSGEQRPFACPPGKLW